jgi:hypothetical protein
MRLIFVVVPPPLRGHQHQLRQPHRLILRVPQQLQQRTQRQRLVVVAQIAPATKATSMSA